MNEVREVKDKNYLLEKEVLFGDMKKALIQNFNKSGFIFGMVFTLIFYSLLIMLSIYMLSFVLDYIDIQNNIIFQIEKIILLLFLLFGIFIGVWTVIRNVVSTIRNVPIPIIQERSTIMAVMFIFVLVFYGDMAVWCILKHNDILSPFINFNLIILVNGMLFIIGMINEKNRIKRLKVDKSKATTWKLIIIFSIIAVIVENVVTEMMGTTNLILMAGIISQPLLLFAGKILMLRIERKKFLRENNLNLLVVRNEMLGINQNEENISY